MKKLKRLKIVEQIIVVLLFAVVTPMVIAGIIVNNVNQHAIRKELNYSALMIAETINNNIYSLLESDESKLSEIVLALKYIPSEYMQSVYLKDVMINSDIFNDLVIVHPSSNKAILNDKSNLLYDNKTRKLTITAKIHNDKYLIATVNIDKLQDKIFNNIKGDKRRIYVIDDMNNIIFSHNYDKEDFEKLIELLPSKLIEGHADTFSKVKNQPLAYMKMPSTNLVIIVNTTKEITERTINTARGKIIFSILAAAFFIIFSIGLYTYYLYINIRQLFKGIMALSKGNYKRRIRLLVHHFTPYEIVFLASEFNKMANEINLSYRQLKQKNRELNRLDEFRSNLIDTVSHEFRTPLTSIKGYTSRLLRQDINIDDEMKHKSLMVIKQQTERLSRMVEDLLVVPDIEGAKLNIQLEAVSLNNIVESSLISIKNIEKREIHNNIPVDFPQIVADKDRLEQVFINLLENANKYAHEGTPITLNAKRENKKAIITVTNKADYIEKQVLERLFEKFTRVDYETTRTTRGTGLGLFIVKGIIQAMNGTVNLISSMNNEFSVQVTLPLREQ